MEQDHRLVENPGHGGAGFLRLGTVKQGFGEFDVPVADLAPDEFIERVGGGVEAVVFQRGVHLCQGLGGFANDPEVGGSLGLRRLGVGRMTRPHAVHLGKPAGVPQFGAEVAVARDALGIQLQRPAERGHRGIGKAQGIGTECVDDLQRVNDVAERFGHLLALGIADQAVQVDRLERHLIHNGQLHHHHPRDPEEDDIRPGDQGGGREILLQFRGVVGPSQGADRPEAGGEPGVEHIEVAPDRVGQMGRVLRQIVIGQGLRQQRHGGVTVGHLDDAGSVQRVRQGGKVVTEPLADRRKVGGAMVARFAFDIAPVAEDGEDFHLIQSIVAFVINEAFDIEVQAIPHRDLMPPPQLARDAPGLDILQPVEIGALAALGHDHGVAVPHGIQRGADDLGGVNEPLVGQHRLDHHFGAVAEGLHEGLGFDHRLQRQVFRSSFLIVGFHQSGDGKASGIDVGHHQLARLEPVKATVFLGHEVEAVDLGFTGGRTGGNLTGTGDGCLIGRSIGSQKSPRVHQAVAGKARAFGDSIIVEIMRAGDLDGTGAEGRVGVVVGDDRDQTVAQRQLDHVAPDGFIALIRGVDGYRAIAQHRLRPCGGDRDVVALFA